MRTWIFALSLELVHPLLLQALVPIRKKDPTVPILILLSSLQESLIVVSAFDNEEKILKELGQLVQLASV